VSSLEYIPEEIREFFSKEGGRSLLVGGMPGTGKTTFALQLLESLTAPERGLYLTTRVSDESLYNQFPWLKDKEMKARIVDSSRMLLDALTPPEEEQKPADPGKTRIVASSKDFLQSIGDKGLTPPSRVDRTRLRILTERMRIPEVERIYDRIETILPNKPTLVIDSVEGITGKYGVDQEDFIFTLQKDLAEHSNTNIVFVTEKSEPDPVEFLVDGVIRFRNEVFEDKRVRHLTIMKLRATEIRQPSYLITLKNGRFRSFKPFGPVIKPGRWTPFPDTETHYSTGIPDLDALLGGGYAKGSYNVIEVDLNVPDDEYQLVLRPILLNFLMHERGIVAVLNGGSHSQAMKEDLARFMPEEQFDRLVRVADYFITQTNLPYVMALGRRDEALRIWRANQEFLRGKESKPIMDYTGFDTLEYLQGGEVAIKGLLEAVSHIKISNDIGVGILKPGLKSAQEIVNMADTYLRVTDIDRRPCIYGLKPKTILYALVPDEEKGMPHVRLEPVV
jgi:KaiC/GvpD/RAD55 family RecA-like ATPase